MISPLDDRYWHIVEPLSEFFSEDRFIHYEVLVEQEYLKALLAELGIRAKLKLTTLTPSDIHLIKRIELKGYRGIPATHHDIKAIEYFLKSRVSPKLREFVHFGITSDDTKNLAHGLMLKGALQKLIIPKANEVLVKLQELAQNKIVMLARTHGQFAAPTSFGKEMLVFATRLGRELEQLRKQKLVGKLNGSVGCYSALKFAYPHHDWEAFSKRFVESLGLEHAAITTQIVPPESYIEIFQTLQRINNILIDLCQDMWRYISDGWLKLRVVKGDIGSSVMPHKVNPIEFENAEGNLKLSSGLIEVFVRELPVSRLQRDLSDSTIKRNFGVLLGHCFLAYDSCLRGLVKIEADKDLMLRIVKQHPEVLAEAYQTELRKLGMPGYELLKELTRGKRVTLKHLHEFIDTLPLPPETKRKLKTLKPENYLDSWGK